MYSIKHITKKTHRTNKGFTLVETLVAVLILTLSIGALLSLSAGGFYSVKYARNQIVANNLLQESLEYIRNTRDTAFQQGLSWSDWEIGLQKGPDGVTDGGASGGCFSTEGCYVNPYTTVAPIKQCVATCPYVLYYPDTMFYGYGGATYPFTPVSAPYQTSFVRTINVTPTVDPNQLQVDATVTWLNGSVAKTITQSILITNWRP